MHHAATSQRVTTRTTTYEPGAPVANKLIDALIALNGLKNDAALSRLLEVAPPVISKMRWGTLPVGASFILKAHELGGMLVADVRKLLAS